MKIQIEEADLRSVLEALENLPEMCGIEEAITAIREALSEQPAKEKAPQSANCEAPGWINSDHARRDDCTTEQATQQELVRDFWYPGLSPQELRDTAQQQEPVAWRNAALRVGEDLCSVGPFGYYDMPAEQWLDWALSVVTVHAPPANAGKPWADSEYSSHWKKADAAKEQFNQLVEDTISEALASEANEQPACKHEWLRGGCLKCGQSIEQPAQQQEPVKVGRITANVKDMVLRQEVMLYIEDYLPIGTAIYTSPPYEATPLASQRSVKPLTDDEILSVARDHYNPHQRPEISFARAIEAKLKEKNA